MSASTRSRRRSTVQASESSLRAQKEREICTLDRLLLSQAVYEVGANAWPQVAKLLSKHPLVPKSKAFNAQGCRSLYNTLMEENELEHDEACDHPKAPIHLQLAEAYYFPRLHELREAILEEEQKFKEVSQEIEEIRAGKWDSKLQEGFKGGSDDGTDPSETIKSEAGSPSLSQVEADEVTESDRPRSDKGDSEEAEVHESVVTSHDGDSVREQTPTPKPSSKRTASRARSSATGSELFVEDATMSRESPSSTVDMDGSMNQNEDADSDTDSQPPTEGNRAGRKSRGGTRRGRSSHTGPNRGSTRPRSTMSGEPEDIPSEPVATRTREGKRRAPAETSEASRDTKRQREESELVTDEPVHPTKRRRGGAQQSVKEYSKRFQTVILMVHDQIVRHKNGTIFHNPIKLSEAPDYHEMIKRPMDLKTIKARIKDGSITNSQEFERDVYLMFANAMMYNRPGSDVHEMAKTMMQDSDLAIKSFRETEEFHKGTR
ncbi:hypothetical protein BDV98DRAFT_569126 [Pterulicium gracile]|uniref:Bromo domain-containing protein n=1 Tax=Pterulicium gracile TaxID=1884261 RepID=A0A5C3QHB6_9AGAR|nr:hypothetical protein BDV98DRAFT_569126 [Pterula gracilis]